MKNFRYSLNRILRSKDHNYDIIKPSTLSFQCSQKAFAASQKELKQLGKAEVCSVKEITEDGKQNLHCVRRSCFEMKNSMKNSMKNPKSCFTIILNSYIKVLKKQYGISILM